MATLQSNGSPITRTSTNNNGGAFLKGIGSNDAPISTQQNEGTRFGTVVASGVDTDSALSNGIFVNESRGVIMKGTDNVAGLSNDFFVYGANDGQKVPTKTESSTISRMPLVQRDGTKYTYSTSISSPRTSDGIRNGKFNVASGAWDSGFPIPSVTYWGTPKLRKVDGPARYFLPNMNEFHKAAYYDPTIRDTDDTQNYWLFATRTDSYLTPCGYDSRGNGIPASDGNSANYGGGGGTSFTDPTSGWNSTTTWRDGQNGLGPLTVGTCGGPSYYGAYDMNYQLHVTEGFGGASFTDTSRFVHIGGAIGLNIQSSCSNYGPRYQLRYSTVAYYPGAGICDGFRIASITNEDNYDLVLVGDPGNSPDGVACVKEPSVPPSQGGLYMGYGLGAVSYVFSIGKYPITNEEYCEFLNSVATNDTYNLYHPNMGNDIYCGIIRTGSAGNYSYAINDSVWNRKAVSAINWYAAARYCNWLHNDKPVGPQVAATTEDGAYTLNGNVTTSVLRNS